MRKILKNTILFFRICFALLMVRYELIPNPYSESRVVVRKARKWPFVLFFALAIPFHVVYVLFKSILNLIEMIFDKDFGKDSQSEYYFYSSATKLSQWQMAKIDVK